MTLSRIRSLLDQRLEPIATTLTDLGTQLSAAHATGFYGPDQRPQMSAQLEGVVRRALADPALLVAGIGVVWEQGTDAGMLWWRADGGVVNRKDHVNNPSSDSFYDFTRMEWYERTTRTDRLVVIGPYVDAWGTDDHTLTPARAVHRDGTRIGVAALDLHVAAMTRELADLLAPHGEDLVLVNADGQVLASDRPDLTPGERLEPHMREHGLEVGATARCHLVEGWSVHRLSRP